MSEDEFLIPEWDDLGIPEDDDAEDDNIDPHGEDEDGDEDGNS